MASQQELRPKGPSAMLQVSLNLREAFDKFEQDFQAANLPEGKFNPPHSTSKWYKLVQPCFEDKLQELNTLQNLYLPLALWSSYGQSPSTGSQGV